MTATETEYQEVVDQYMHGYCMFMAAALHHYYGFQIGLVAVMYSGRGTPCGERLSHAWVTTPDGKCLDIQGEQSLKQMTQFVGDCPEAGYVLHEVTTLEHLERLAGCKLPPNEIDVLRALMAARRFLVKELRKWES